MTDEQDKQPVVPGEGDAQATPTAPVIDDWASAFESLEEPATPAAGDDEASAAGTGGADVPGATGPEGVSPTDTTVTDAGAAPVGAGDAGGPVPDTAGAGAADAAGGTGDLGDVTATIERYTTEVEQRAIDETARMFAERADDQGNKLIRQTNGQLGATINDPDIYRVDENGAPAFYNPDTGRPFTGDNPRAQAKAWVDAYNEELRDTFNRLAEQRKGELVKEIEPVVELLKFTPTYEKLDSVRQKMLDALIEDYEVYDAQNNHIGYSIDLNQALARVNKQIAAIQASRQADPAAAAAAPAAPTGPALDMPTTGGGSVPGKTFANLGEALEAQQDAELAKLKK